MLELISKASLTDGELFAASGIKGWVAIDTETGAFLGASNGRTRNGDTKYYLILPNRTPEERGGLLAKYDWDDKDRKRFRAWSDEEALEIANQRLAKMLKERSK